MILISAGRLTLAARHTSKESLSYSSFGEITQFFYRAANRGEQFRGDYQKLYDEGVHIAVKYLDE
jgi:hypothetical protein